MTSSLLAIGAERALPTDPPVNCRGYGHRMSAAKHAEDGFTFCEASRPTRYFRQCRMEARAPQTTAPGVRRHHGEPARRIIGLNHYHVTGWVKSLELFRDRLEIVALYDPDPARGATLAPTPP